MGYHPLHKKRNSKIHFTISPYHKTIYNHFSTHNHVISRKWFSTPYTKNV